MGCVASIATLHRDQHVLYAMAALSTRLIVGRLAQKKAAIRRKREKAEYENRKRGWAASKKLRNEMRVYRAHVEGGRIILPG